MCINISKLQILKFTPQEYTNYNSGIGRRGVIYYPFSTIFHLHVYKFFSGLYSKCQSVTQKQDDQFRLQRLIKYTIDFVGKYLNNYFKLLIKIKLIIQITFRD
jgi:hypothetical protein